MNDACSALGFAVDPSPSIVRTCLPSMAESGMRQENTGRPSMMTVHAPHCPRPHPNFTPQRPSRLLKYSPIKRRSFPYKAKGLAIFHNPEAGRHFIDLFVDLATVSGLITAITATVDGFVPANACARGCRRPCSARTSGRPSLVRAPSPGACARRS